MYCLDVHEQVMTVNTDHLVGRLWRYIQEEVKFLKGTQEVKGTSEEKSNYISIPLDLEFVSLTTAYLFISLVFFILLVLVVITDFMVLMTTSKRLTYVWVPICIRNKYRFDEETNMKSSSQ